MDPLSIRPALVPFRPDQRVEQDLAILVQDPDLDEIVDPIRGSSLVVSRSRKTVSPVLDSRLCRFLTVSAEITLSDSQRFCRTAADSSVEPPGRLRCAA